VPPPTPAMRWGVTCEDYLREGGVQDKVKVIPTNVLNKDGHRRGASYKEWVKEYEGSGLELLTPSEYTERYSAFTDIVGNIKAHEIARMFVVDIPAQVEGAWNQQYAWYEEMHDLEMRCELDIRGCDWVIDVKTCQDNTERGFMRSVIDYGYDLQAYVYLSNFTDHRFAWVAIKSSPPYSVECYTASESLLELGRQKFEAYARHYRECRETKSWRSATHNQLITVDAPEWAYNRFYEEQY